jgi:hypothetical protein
MQRRKKKNRMIHQKRNRAIGNRMIILKVQMLKYLRDLVPLLLVE